MKNLIPQTIKNIYHFFVAILANVFYGFPSKKLTVIGVTGTNGKTTTIQMMARILEEAGHKVAMASTINFKIGEIEWINDTKFTTLSAWAVQKFIRLAANAGCQYLLLEVSSHSLDQNRIWGVKFKTAVITNVTREHLDYHKTIDQYRKAKKGLFRKVETAIVNLDMDRPEEFLNCKAKIKFAYTCHPELFSGSNPNRFRSKPGMTILIAENIELGTNYSKFKIQNSQFKLNLLGRFNIENALAAACAGIDEGIRMEIIKEALGKIKGIPGRMEMVENNRGINIIIDYAVTPDSLEKLYELISKMKKNQPGARVISIFGSCGERDRGKRPIMGKIVSAYADNIIITNEDPYGEDPVRIINEISSGVENKKEGYDFWKILDRREAIKKALALAGPGDFLVVTGKGAEETMAIGKERIPWNDKKVILEVLQEL